MSLIIEAQLKDVHNLRKYLREAPEEYYRGLRRAVKKSSSVLRSQAVRNAPVDTGQLRSERGMHSDISTDGLTARIGSSLKYALYVHEGTRPHYVPISAISGWARRHKIPVGAVQRSILRKGTKANPFLREAVEQTEDKVGRIFYDEIEKSVLNK